MESELTEIIGYRADLKTINDLSPYFRDEVLARAKQFMLNVTSCLLIKQVEQAIAVLSEN